MLKLPHGSRQSNTNGVIHSFCSLPCYSLLFFFSIFKSWLSRDHTGKPQLPPGSRGWPLIGETIDFILTAKKGIPEKFIQDRKKKYSSDVFQTSLLGENMVMLCNAEGNKFLFSNENKLVESWWPSTFAKIFANPGKTISLSEDTFRFRKLLSPFIKLDGLQKYYIGVMDTKTKQFLQQHWHNRETVMFHHMAKKYTLELGCTMFLNIEDPQELSKFQRIILKISSGMYAVPLNVPGTKYWRAIRESKKLQKEIEKIIKQRNFEILAEFANRTRFTHLIQETHRDGETLNEADVAHKVFGLLIGAYDNVSMTLVSIVKYLAELPEVYDNVFRGQMEIARSKAAGELLTWGDLQKMKYSWNVVCEALRLWPPIVGTFRVAKTDFIYEGFLIPKGCKFHWNAGATHRNSEYFPNPEKFDPSRFEGNGPTVPFSYVPFGGGLRLCPGNEYARLNLLVFIHNVVTQFKWEKVFPDEEIIYDPILIPVKGLPILLFPHEVTNHE